MKEAALLLPPQVAKLAPREREVATIIYAKGPCTALDIERLITSPPSNAAIRSMLFRLVRKGILKRELGKRGRGNKFTYFPAITPKEVKWRALKQLSEQYFEGSLRTMMSELSDAIGTSGEPSLKSGASRSARDVKLVPHE